MPTDLFAPRGGQRGGVPSGAGRGGVDRFAGAAAAGLQLRSGGMAPRLAGGRVASGLPSALPRPTSVSAQVPEARPRRDAKSAERGPIPSVQPVRRPARRSCPAPVLAAASSGAPGTPVPQMADGAGEDRSMFARLAPHLVRQPRPAGEPSLPDPADSLYLELLRRFQRRRAESTPMARPALAGGRPPRKSPRRHCGRPAGKRRTAPFPVPPCLMNFRGRRSCSGPSVAQIDRTASEQELPPSSP